MKMMVHAVGNQAGGEWGNRLRRVQGTRSQGYGRVAHSQTSRCRIERSDAVHRAEMALTGFEHGSLDRPAARDTDGD